MNWAGPSAQGRSVLHMVTPARLILLFPNLCTLSASLPSHREPQLARRAQPSVSSACPPRGAHWLQVVLIHTGLGWGSPGAHLLSQSWVGPLGPSVFDFPFHLCSTFSSGQTHPWAEIMVCFEVPFQTLQLFTWGLLQSSSASLLGIFQNALKYAIHDLNIILKFFCLEANYRTMILFMLKRNLCVCVCVCVSVCV